MADPFDAAGRAIAAVDQQLAACRDANGRLTARIVQLEAEARRMRDDLAYYREMLATTEHLLGTTAKALTEVQRMSDQFVAQLRNRDAEIDRLWGSIMRGEL